jgi:hypothetical protein
MTQKIPKAATRARSPTNRPRLPRSWDGLQTPCKQLPFFWLQGFSEYQPNRAARICSRCSSAWATMNRSTESATVNSPSLM